ncbi:MAG: hypothetical protein DRQ51_01870 [Gammaproteobacteria bacterium]|nr:MAG: hypothetical protein DRQ51_01870 [Gammaproteobacteria bacterium]
MIKTFIPVLIGASFLLSSCDKNPDAELLSAVTDCEVNMQKCTKKIADGGEIEFEVLPKNSPQLKPLTLTLNTKNIDIQEVSVIFKGRNMEMGQLPTKLKKINNDKFSGTGILSICTLFKMDWEAMVHIKTDKKYYKVPFYFSTFNLPPEPSLQAK